MLRLTVYHPQATKTEKHKIGKFPFRIGRSLENDLVLDDPFISAQHAEIVQDGPSIFVRDCASTNGIICNGKKADNISVGGNSTEFSLGSYKFYLTSGPDPLEDTLIHEFQFRSKNRTRFELMVSYLLGGAALFCVVWLENYTAADIGKAKELFSRFVGVALWTLGIAALLSVFFKIQSGRYHLLKVAPLVCLGVALLSVVGFICDAFFYNAGLGWTGWTSLYLLYGLWFVIFFYPIGRIVFAHLSRRTLIRRILYADILLVFIGAFFVWTIWLDSGQTSRSYIGYPIVSSSFYAHDMSQVVDDIRKSAKKVDKTRAETLKRFGR